MCPRIGGRDRPSNPGHRLLELSRLEEIFSRFFTAGRIEPGDPLRMVARQSTWQAGHEMNSLLSHPDLYS